LLNSSKRKPAAVPKIIYIFEGYAKSNLQFKRFFLSVLLEWAPPLLRPLCCGVLRLIGEEPMRMFLNIGTVDVISNPPLAEGKKRKGRGKTTELSIQKKRKDSDNGKLKVIIPPDRTIAVGPGANDSFTKLSVKVVHNARHDVKNWI
ncbi:hypothetical protein A4A49_52111, partial [Nicotiana attenuata]